MEALDHLIRMADVHPFLAFCEIWLIGCIAGVVFKIINRAYRTIKVCCRGWPPEHLDADGDFKPERESD